MSNISIFYLIIAVAATIGVILIQRQLKYRAKVVWGWKIFYLVVMVLFAVGTLIFSKSLDDYISGFLVVYFLFLFLMWRQGLSKTGTVNGTNRSRPYNSFTKLIAQPGKEHVGTTLIMEISGMGDAQMQFKQTPEEIGKYIKQYAQPKKVEIRQERVLRTKKETKK